MTKYREPIGVALSSANKGDRLRILTGGHIQVEFYASANIAVGSLVMPTDATHVVPFKPYVPIWTRIWRAIKPN